MDRKTVEANRAWGATLLATLAIWAGVSGTGWSQGFTPNHEVVQEMLDRGVAYLESGSPGRGDIMSGNGGPMLAAMCIIKHRGEMTHPKIEQGLDIARVVARDTVNEVSRISGERQLYEVPVAIMLMCSAGAENFHDELTLCRDFLVRAQRPYGAFGYLHGERTKTGDTSQTQYGMLGAWTLDQHNFFIEAEPIERLVQWMQVTQDPSGGWGYQGQIGRLDNLIQQQNLSHSLSAAGMSALLIGGDFLNFYRNRRADTEEDDVPRAFRRIIENADPAAEKQVTMSRADIQRTVDMGVAYHVNRPYRRNESTPEWYYYYMYSTERMYAFLEIANMDKKKPEKSPKWYNDGVLALRKYQDPEAGGWGDKDKEFGSSEVSTSFAVLYLMRSTQKSIGAVKEEVLSGGSGNLENVANLKFDGNKLVDKKAVDPVQEAMESFEKSAEAKIDDIVASDRVKLKQDPKQRKDQLNRFARVLRNSPPEARRAAARLLGRGDDLDFAPDLIYALTDPIDEIARAAETSLQILSRRMTTRYLPADQPLTSAQRAEAIAKWREWYLSVRPDHLFIQE